MRSGSRARDIIFGDQIYPTSCTFNERSVPSSVTIKSDPWFEFSEVQVSYRTRQICDTVRLRVFTRLICLFHLGLPSLPFLSSLVKPTATRSDFLHNPRKLQRAALASWFEAAIINGPAERLLFQICAKIRRGRDARMLFCLIYSSVPFPNIAFRIIISFRKLATCHSAHSFRLLPSLWCFALFDSLFFPRETSSATKSEEKRMFAQARLVLTWYIN